MGLPETDQLRGRAGTEGAVLIQAAGARPMPAGLSLLPRPSPATDPGRRVRNTGPADGHRWTVRPFPRVDRSSAQPVMLLGCFRSSVPCSRRNQRHPKGGDSSVNLLTGGDLGHWGRQRRPPARPGTSARARSTPRRQASNGADVSRLRCPGGRHLVRSWPRRMAWDHCRGQETSTWPGSSVSWRCDGRPYGPVDEVHGPCSAGRV